MQCPGCGAKPKFSGVDAAGSYKHRNGCPYDPEHIRELAEESRRDRLGIAAYDHALVLAALISGRARWEPFTGDSIHGELCFGGMRYATKLDEFGCPVVNDLIREGLEQ